MAISMKKLILAAAFLMLTAPAFAQQDPKPMPPGPTGPLTIVTADGKTHDFQVELADTPEKSELGLMYRKEMAKDHGMIFDFGPTASETTGMWMKNCFFAQDMLFMDADGKVIAIAENARPGSLRVISPGIPFKSVLELNGGVVKSLGIKPGDKVQHKIFTVKAAATPKPANTGVTIRQVPTAPKNGG